jgi:BirA family biotin operon repressor/biotin-[acetyl-CoA-carboxylase] ligase
VTAPAPAGALGALRLHLRSVDSTNLRALTLAAGGAPHGTLVTAGEQTAGRGRHGRSWSAPPGSGLLMSLVLRDPRPLLPVIAGVAVADAVGGGVLLKWPNDVVVMAPQDDPGPWLRKLAGILIDTRPLEGYAVLGIGVNVALRVADLPPEVGGRAASLGLAPAAVDDVLAAVLRALEHRLGQSDGELLSAWRARDVLRGREVRWADGEGLADGVDDEGRLIVRTHDGELLTLDGGEVHLLEDGS